MSLTILSSHRQSSHTSQINDFANYTAISRELTKLVEVLTVFIRHQNKVCERVLIESRFKTIHVYTAHSLQKRRSSPHRIESRVSTLRVSATRSGQSVFVERVPTWQLRSPILFDASFPTSPRRRSLLASIVSKSQLHHETEICI